MGHTRETWNVGKVRVTIVDEGGARVTLHEFARGRDRADNISHARETRKDHRPASVPHDLWDDYFQDKPERSPMAGHKGLIFSLTVDWLVHRFKG